MKEQKKAPRSHELKDREVPPVKGAVTEPEDILRRPAAIFGPAHPLEPLDKANAAIFDTFM
ncbi:MAG: hypothetical protein J6J43_04315 [Oscillospiraceae bacterium]|nr:hypothetical protein [Oscillospiraceae bacterium]